MPSGPVPFSDSLEAGEKGVHDFFTDFVDIQGLHEECGDPMNQFKPFAIRNAPVFIEEVLLSVENLLGKVNRILGYTPVFFLCLQDDEDIPYGNGKAFFHRGCFQRLDLTSVEPGPVSAFLIFNKELAVSPNHFHMVS